MVRQPDRKTEALKQGASLNPHPERVGDPRFHSGGFFDPRDLVQVKYEMVRRVQVEGDQASRTARAFGFSRPTFYSAQAAFAGGGLPALVPGKSGPRGPRKLTEEVMDFLDGTLAMHPSLGPRDLAAIVTDRFGITVHPRSIERALNRRQEKKLR